MPRLSRLKKFSLMLVEKPSLLTNAGDMVRGRAAGLVIHKGHDHGLEARALVEGSVGRLAADVGLVNGNRLAFAAERAAGEFGLQGFAKAMRKEPRGLIGDAEHPVQLM